MYDLEEFKELDRELARISWEYDKKHLWKLGVILLCLIAIFLILIFIPIFLEYQTEQFYKLLEPYS